MEQQNTPAEKAGLIDPIYQKFTKGVLRAISSTEFYEYFMDALSKADNQIQFSNRKLEKTVDLHWVDEIERALPAMQNIIANPRNIIREEELIVNAAHAKKAGEDVVRHLSQHASFVEDYQPDTGDVRPSKLMQKYREDSEELYENRLALTTIEMAFHFVKIRHDALFDAMSDEFGAKLKVDSEMSSATESVRMEMFLHIKETESAMDADERNADVFGRISRLYRLLGTFMNSKFAQQMMKVPRVKGTVVKTNVLKKNPDYRAIERLFSFMRTYGDVGYSIRVVEQSPQISETFQRDIFHNILFNYMVLKGYLQDADDRVVPTKPMEKRRELKPKFIHQIIEELTEDYDLPDVEIRKVLIEELTKEQLMKEEAQRRRELVEEQARKKKEEAERIRQEKEAERQRIRQEKEAEKERIRQEKEAEKQRQLFEKMQQEVEDRRRGSIFRKELEHFAKDLESRLEARREDELRYLAEKEDFSDAARLVEEAEQRKQEMLERQRKRQQEEQERLRREEEERLAQLRREQQEREQRAKAEALARQVAIDKQLLANHIAELQYFEAQLPRRKAGRAEYIAYLQEQERQFLLERQQRQAQRSTRP